MAPVRRQTDLVRHAPGDGGIDAGDEPKIAQGPHRDVPVRADEGQRGAIERDVDALALPGQPLVGGVACEPEERQVPSGERRRQRVERHCPVDAGPVGAVEGRQGQGDRVRAGRGGRGGVDEPAVLGVRGGAAGLVTLVDGLAPLLQGDDRPTGREEGQRS